MARSRNIKPGTFLNETLAELPALTRLAFIAFWTVADFKGCVEWRPKRLKLQVLPYDDVDMEQIADDLARAGFIIRYSVGEQAYIKISNFEKHQNPHKKERDAGSDVPDVPVDTGTGSGLTGSGSEEVLKSEMMQVVDNQGVDLDRNHTGTTPALAMPLPDSLLLIPDSLTHNVRACDSVPLKAIEDGSGNGKLERSAFVARSHHKGLGSGSGGSNGSLPDVDMSKFGPYRDAVEDWYCSATGTVSLPPNAAAVEQLTWLFENGFTIDEIKGFYEFATTDPEQKAWRKGSVNLGAIVKGIGEWRAEKQKSEVRSQKSEIDFSWCANGCDARTGLIAVTVDGVDGMKQCEHVRRE